MARAATWCRRSFRNGKPLCARKSRNSETRYFQSFRSGVGLLTDTKYQGTSLSASGAAHSGKLCLTGEGTFLRLSGEAEPRRRYFESTNTVSLRLTAMCCAGGARAVHLQRKH